MMPTGRKPLNQSIHGMVTLVALAINAIATVFGASAVMNMLLDTMLAASAVKSRYAPTFFADGSFGYESYNSGMLRTTGEIHHPERAVADGVTGASARSAKVMA